MIYIHYLLFILLSTYLPTYRPIKIYLFNILFYSIKKVKWKIWIYSRLLSLLAWFHWPLHLKPTKFMALIMYSNQALATEEKDLIIDLEASKITSKGWRIRSLGISMKFWETTMISKVMITELQDIKTLSQGNRIEYQEIIILFKAMAI